MCLFVLDRSYLSVRGDFFAPPAERPGEYFYLEMDAIPESVLTPDGETMLRNFIKGM